MGNRNMSKYKAGYSVCVLCLALCILNFAVNSVSADTEEDIDSILKRGKLKEEMNLTGATLKELVREEPVLTGLEGISLRIISLPVDTTTESLARAISTHYRTKATDEGWQVIRHRIDEGKAILICGKEENGIRNRLRILIIDPPEFSEMNLTGKMELSALDRLRRVIARSMPGLDDTYSMDRTSAVSPSQAARTVARLKSVIETQREKTPAEVYYRLGEAYKQIGEYNKALSVYGNIMQRDDVPEWVQMRTYQDMAKSSEHLGRPDDARTYYELLRRDFGHRDLEQLYQWKQRSEKDSASEEDPLSMIYKLGEYEKAIDTYREMGLDYEYANPPEVQINVFKQLVEQDPRTASWNHLGLAYQRGSMYEKAIEQYKSIIETPNSYELGEAYLNTGRCLEALGKVAEAKKYYKELSLRFQGDHRQGVQGEKALIRMERGDSQPTLGLGLKFAGSKNATGVPIATVFRNGPCKAAGVQPGDILLAIDSMPTRDARSVIRIIGWEKNIGDEVTLLIRRGTQEMLIPVTLIEMPERLER